MWRWAPMDGQTASREHIKEFFPLPKTRRMKRREMENIIYIYIIYMFTETVGWWGGDSKGRYGMTVCARRGTSCVLTWLWFHGCLVTRMSSTHARAWVCMGLCVLHKTETARDGGGRRSVAVSAEVYNIIVQSTTVAVVVQWKIFFVVAICRHPSSLEKSPPSAHSKLT